MAKLVAKTYGDALFELAVEENRLDVITDDVQVLAEVFENNQELTGFMSHPKISKEEKQEVIATVLAKATKEVAGFVNIIIEKGRYLELPDIFRYFIECVKEYNNIGTASVTTAAELSEAQKKQVVERLLATTKYETMEVEYSVDSALIGGMVIRIGDRVVDSSIQTKLHELTKELTAIQLAL